MGVLVLIASRVTQVILARSTRATAFASQCDGGWSSLGQLVLPLSLLSVTVAGTWRRRAPADRIFVTPAILAFAFVYSRSCSNAARSPSHALVDVVLIASWCGYVRPSVPRSGRLCFGSTVTFFRIGRPCVDRCVCATHLLNVCTCWNFTVNSWPARKPD